MIESIDRALAVLQLFLKEERPLSVTRISKVMELHKSTVSRTLETLEHRGFIQKDEETGKYWLGLQAYALGMLFRERINFIKWPIRMPRPCPCNAMKASISRHLPIMAPPIRSTSSWKRLSLPGQSIRHRLSAPSARPTARHRASVYWPFQRTIERLIRAVP